MQPYTECYNLCSPLRTHIPSFYLSLSEIWQSVTVPEVQLWVNIKSNIGGELVCARQSWRTPWTLTSLLDVQSPSTARGWWSRTCRAPTSCFADQREQNLLGCLQQENDIASRRWQPSIPLLGWSIVWQISTSLLQDPYIRISTSPIARTTKSRWYWRTKHIRVINTDWNGNIDNMSLVVLRCGG